VIAKSLLGAVLALVLSSEPQALGTQAYAGERRPASSYVVASQVPKPPADKQGPAAASVFFAEQPGIDHLCGGRDKVIACAQIGGGTMALPNPCQPRFAGESYAAVVCHEKGHILGWSHEE
jgi:hypothetical protein